MDFDSLQKQLLAAARKQPPNDRVPYAFEKRIMARVTAVRPVDAWTRWGFALWRAAASCVAVMLLVTLWTVWTQPDTANGGDFSREFESAVFASTSQVDLAE